MSQISDLIKRLRAEPTNLSQSEISRKTGIPQPRISRWESGDVAAGADDALRLVALAKEVGLELETGIAAQEPVQTGKTTYTRKNGTTVTDERVKDVPVIEVGGLTIDNRRAVAKAV